MVIKYKLKYNTYAGSLRKTRTRYQSKVSSGEELKLRWDCSSWINKLSFLKHIFIHWTLFIADSVVDFLINQSINKSCGAYAGSASPPLWRHSRRSRPACFYAASLPILSNSRQQASTCHNHVLVLWASFPWPPDGRHKMTSTCWSPQRVFCADCIRDVLPFFWSFARKHNGITALFESLIR